jgi:NAD(P)-dependent dehydrogenase (short-subunit alcohol dehydrogenase family)
MSTLKELMDLHGRVALVTGGAGLIGSEMCEALAELGAAVAVLDCDGPACRRLAQRLKDGYGVDAEPLIVDLADEAATRAASSTVLDRFGRLDILVNSAAFTGTSDLQGWITPWAQQSAETWRKVLDLNLLAPFVLTQACTPALERSGKGTVVNIISTYGLVGPDMRIYEGTSMGNPSAYAGSKGGLLQLTRWLATVLAPKIRVNAISPGGVYVDQPEPFRRQYVARTPLQRMACGGDYKGAIAYLASDLSAYCTGHNLVVDGGWTAW